MRSHAVSPGSILGIPGFLVSQRIPEVMFRPRFVLVAISCPSMQPSFDPGAAAAPGSGIFGLPHAAAEARVIVVPVPFAATTSYGGGAERGPEAVLRASRQVDLYDLEAGRVYAPGIHMLEPS